MFKTKSSKRDKAEGRLDRIGARLMELVGRITGRSDQKAKGKAARARGSARTRRGRTKQRVRS